MSTHLPTSLQEDDVTELSGRIKKANLPEEVRMAAEKEVKRLKRMQSSQPEYTVSTDCHPYYLPAYLPTYIHIYLPTYLQVVRNYLEWVLDLPWSVSDEEKYDVMAVEEQMDKDHYGLEKVGR